MPLVKGIQEKFGHDKVDVLMLSVDGGRDEGDRDTLNKSQQCLRKFGSLGWTSVMSPKGWDDVQRTFNLDGYGLTLVGPDGIVRGINIRPDDVERLLARM